MLAAMFAAASTASPAGAQQLKNINLNQPDMTRRATLMKAFEDRRSTREFSTKELSLQDLSDLLWAANGYNRPVEKKRTAPTAMNKQEIDVYAFTKDGVYLYDAEAHELKHISTTDAREYIAAGQAFAKDAPVALLIVSDMGKFGNASAHAAAMSAVDAGIVSQNISLFCAGAGLATVPRGTMDKGKIADLLGFDDKQVLHVNHPVGYMK